MILSIITSLKELGIVGVAKFIFKMFNWNEKRKLKNAKEHLEILNSRYDLLKLHELYDDEDSN